MSGDASISGRILINPPVGWDELHDKEWALGRVDFPDAWIKTESTTKNTATGTNTTIVGTAIVVTDGETSARTLVADLNQIVHHFGTTPDGQTRTFSGFIHMMWAGGEAIYRLFISDGKVHEVQPEMQWPEGARDEDAVPNPDGWNGVA